MATLETFRQAVTQGYAFRSEAVPLGTAVLDGKPLTGVLIGAPLRTFNRHGLIAGATGTGKTKTLQRMAEALSARGVPVLMMDIKGDVSGISMPGMQAAKVDERHAAIGIPWKPAAYPVEFLTLSGEPGVRLRATVSEFGPVLFSKILGINDTQAGVVSVVFKYCDDQKLPLLDLKDFKKALQFLTNEGKTDIEKDYGRISTATSGTILRKVLELEQEGADQFFGEMSFDVEDLLRIDEKGRGTISIIRLSDLQSKPRMFSTFMLALLAELYARLPEEGDPEQPKLVMVIDEAHLVFQEASRELLEQLETIIKLIRSKGVGVFFCTQSPTDIPASVLGQLGMKIQHALRAFTAQDRKAIKLVAENYPETKFYNTEDLITSLGIGEAFVTVLNEQGSPTPLVHCLLCAPESRMGPLTPQELQQHVTDSGLVRKYGQVLDRESAYEMLTAKIEHAAGSGAPGELRDAREGKTTVEKVLEDPLTRQIGRTVARELTRGLLGALGIGGRRRSIF
jgi:hypothetical protein